MGSLPGVIGAIDGTFIPIPAPKEDQESYYNRKKFHAVILQAVCMQNMAFSDCYVGWPGSCHDARVLRNSKLYQNVDTLFNPEFYIIGDPAYPIRSWLMVAYKENGRLTPSHRLFNKSLSKTRVVIEQAFSLLKGRFRRLKFLDIRDMKELNETVMMCCILHNVLLHEGNFEEFFDPTGEDSTNQVEGDDADELHAKAEGENKREWLRNYISQ